MKKHYSRLFPLLFIILINLLPDTAFGQYIPVRTDIEGIYLCEPIIEFSELYRSRSTIDHQEITSEGNVYYPYRTLTDLNHESFECGLIFTNNWMGDSIIHQINSDSYTFHFTPIKNGGSNVGFELSSPDTLIIPGGLIVGSKFMIDQWIEAEVISESTETWNGIQLQKQTIRLTNSGNPDYKWDSGHIVLTKDHGIYNFPNLQYFPFEWKNVALAGITEGQIGMQDISSKDTYRMSPGDEYTAEYKQSFFPTGITTNFFDRNRCLFIMEEDEMFQRISIQSERLHIILPSGSWEYTIDTILENIIYDQRQIRGRANETIDHEFPYTAQVVISENGNKYLNDYVPSFSSQNCYREHIDACYNYYAFKGGFTTYFDCSGIFNFEHYYLPRHRIFNGEEFGDDVFDSIKTLKNKTVDLSNVEIYPNPNNGIFSVRLLNNLVIQNYFIVDINGNRKNIIPDSDNNNILNFDLNLQPGIYYLQGRDISGNNVSLGKIIIVK